MVSIDLKVYKCNGYAKVPPNILYNNNNKLDPIMTKMYMPIICILYEFISVKFSDRGIADKMISVTILRMKGEFYIYHLQITAVWNFNQD